MKRIILTLLITVTAAVAGAHAQTTTLKSYVIGAGGGTSSGTGMTMHATLGQAIIGPATSAGIIGLQGFWYTTVTRTTTAVREERGSTVGQALSLQQNYPNPFSDETHLRLTIPSYGHVSLKLYDGLGREVKTLIDGDRAPGIITLSLTADDLTSGRYTAQLVMGTVRRIVTMTVVK